MRSFGMTRRELEDRLAGPNTLLNLSYTVHPPFLLRFEKRLLCDLDPSEFAYWMPRVEMGQSTHHEFDQYKRCRSILSGIVVDATLTNGHDLCRDAGAVMLIDP